MKTRARPWGACLLSGCLLAVSGLTPGCTGAQSVLYPAGPQAAHIHQLWWVMFWVCAAVFVLVMGFLLFAVWHPRRQGGQTVASPTTERRLAGAVLAAAAVTVLVLFGLLAVDFLTNRALAALSAPQPLTIKVTGHQWWWDIRYADSTPSQMLTTANELHIPVGQPVLLELTSQDVIHSFWVPNLHGKKDLIPGRVTTLWLQADRPGVFRGQCAEFCGHQHAYMAFLVIAEPPERFSAWLEAQRRPAEQPVDATAQRGQQVFLSSSCGLCHTVSGTLAGGKMGPDLTHLASRLTLAAGTLPNSRGHLAGWIVDAQQIKPGNKMPPNLLAAEELHALLAYLESLK
jgi:cytochrome c oxidase subunit II